MSIKDFLELSLLFLAFFKPFSNPQKTNSTSDVRAPERKVTPRFDPLTPGALVMPRPNASHQVGRIDLCWVVCHA